MRDFPPCGYPFRAGHAGPFRRTMAVLFMKKFGLALGGGGARGLCHIAFIQAMEELGVRPSIVSGTSIGAVIGAFCAAGVSGQRMEELVDSVGLLQLSRMADFSLFGQHGLVKGRRVADFLKKNLPVKTFEELPIPLKIVATDFWNSHEAVFDSGDLIEAIRASISVPGVFTPVLVKDRVYVDGLLFNPVPYDIIRDQCEVLAAIDVSGRFTCTKADPLPSIFETIMGTIHVMETSMMENKLKVSRPDMYLKPDLHNIQILDFHKKEEIMESARPEVRRFKGELEAMMSRKKLFAFRRR